MRPNSKVYGALDSELAVLSALILDRSVLSDVRRILTPSYFIQEKCEILYRAMLNIIDSGLLPLNGKPEPFPLDILTSHLEKLGVLDRVGGKDFIVELAESTLTTASLPYHLRQIKIRSLRRRARMLADIKDEGEFYEQLKQLHNDATLVRIGGCQELESIIISAEQYQTFNLPPTKMFLNPWLRENSITLVSGWRGIGKTFCALQSSTAVGKC